MPNLPEDPQWTVLPAGSRLRMVDEREDPPYIEFGREIVAVYAPCGYENAQQGCVLTCRGDVLLLGNQFGDTPGWFFEIELPS